MKTIIKNRAILLCPLLLGIISCSNAAENQQFHSFSQLINASYILDLHSCKISDTSLRKLSEELKNNTIVTNIQLSSNYFTDAGFKTFVDILPSTVIKTLSLNDNNITDEGMSYFCISSYAKDANSPLRYIDVRGNPITDKTRTLLAQFACLKPHVQVICSWNTSEILKCALAETPIVHAVGIVEIMNNRNISDARCAITLKRLITQGGIDYNAQQQGGYTLLHHAIEQTCTGNNRIESIRILCEAGANLRVVETQGRTPLDFACVYGNIDIIELLLQYAEKQK